MSKYLNVLLGLVLVALSSPAWASWSLVQNVSTVSCPSSSTTCTITVAPTGSGHLLAVGVDLTLGSHVTGVSGAGTWNLCAGSSCNSNHTDMAYNLASSAGVTSITVTVSTTQQINGIEVLEYATTNPPVLLDVVGTAAQDALCSPCAGVALSLTGSNDVIIQFATNHSTSFTAITSPYSNPFDLFNTNNAAIAGALNTVSGAAPTWSISGASGATNIAAIAFKESASPTGHRNYLVIE